MKQSLGVLISVFSERLIVGTLIAPVILVSLLMIGCQTTQTTVGQRQTPTPGPITLPHWSDEGPLALTKETVQIDVRPSFEYSIAHPIGAQSFRVQDFLLNEASKQSYQRQAEELARRLAMRGIGPGRPHVIIGSGKNGEGEEGYLAWLLFTLGVEQVSFVPFQALKVRVTNEMHQSVENIPPWSPVIKSSLVMTPAQFQKLFQESQPFSSGQSKKNSDVVLLDVRRETEFLNKERGGPRRRLPNAGALNIPWKEWILTHTLSVHIFIERKVVFHNMNGIYLGSNVFSEIFAHVSLTHIVGRNIKLGLTAKSFS
jgi:3-mercaptopyruvate sulfurtransferase SseA